MRRAPKRAAAGSAQRWEREDFSGECERRQLEQVLCPRGCKCGNALAADGSPGVVRVVKGGGVELSAKGSLQSTLLNKEQSSPALATRRTSGEAQRATSYNHS